MGISIVFIGALVLGVFLVIPGLILLLTSKENRAIGIALIVVGCLFALGSVGTFFLIVSRMG